MLWNRRSKCLPSVEHLFQDPSRTIMTFCLQNCFQCYGMAFFIGYQVEGCFRPSKSRNLPYVPWQVNSSIVRYFTKGTSVTRSPVITKTGWLKCQWCGASPPPDDSPLLGKSRTNMGDPYHIDADGIVTLSAMRELELLPVLFTLPPIRRWHTFWHYEGFF